MKKAIASNSRHHVARERCKWYSNWHQAEAHDMSSTTRRIGLAGLLSLIAPLPVVAAPFCIESMALPPQCMYYDAGLCQQAADQQHGLCAVNPNEVKVSPGIGHYCLLTSSLVSSCIYTDRRDCQRDATVQHGACVDAPSRPESPAADPFRFIRPSMAGG
jgi:hypothetical protein